MSIIRLFILGILVLLPFRSWNTAVPPHSGSVAHTLRSTKWRHTPPHSPPHSPSPLQSPPSSSFWRSHPCFTRGSQRRANQSRRFFFVILSSLRGLSHPCISSQLQSFSVSLLTFLFSSVRLILKSPYIPNLANFFTFLQEHVIFLHCLKLSKNNLFSSRNWL